MAELRDEELTITMGDRPIQIGASKDDPVMRDFRMLTEPDGASKMIVLLRRQITEAEIAFESKKEREIVEHMTGLAEKRADLIEGFFTERRLVPPPAIIESLRSERTRIGLLKSKM